MPGLPYNIWNDAKFPGLSLPKIKIKKYENNIKEEDTYQGHNGQSWSHLSASGALSFHLILYLNKPPCVVQNTGAQEYPVPV